MGRKKNLFLLDAFALGEPLADGRDGLWAGATVGRWFAEGFFLEGEGGNCARRARSWFSPSPFSPRPRNGTLVANTADTVAVAWRARDSPNRRKSAPYRRHTSFRLEQHFGGFLLPPTLEGERKGRTVTFIGKGDVGVKKPPPPPLSGQEKGGRDINWKSPLFRFLPLPPPSFSPLGKTGSRLFRLWGERETERRRYG